MESGAIHIGASSPQNGVCLIGMSNGLPRWCNPAVIAAIRPNYRRDRGLAAAQTFFRKALASTPPREPRKVTLDGHVPSRRALWLLRREHPCWRNVKVRTNKYLNNLIEQDHRAIKRRCASMAGFKSFANAAITIAGIELAHRIRKRQFSFGRRRRRHGWSRKAECNGTRIEQAREARKAANLTTVSLDAPEPSRLTGPKKRDTPE
jgi:hypothetical protein